MSILLVIVLFAVAAVAEIGGAWLVWQSVREGQPWWWAGLGVMALGAYGFVATLQPDAHFGRILAAYGGVFVVALRDVGGIVAREGGRFLRGGDAGEAEDGGGGDKNAFHCLDPFR